MTEKVKQIPVIIPAYEPDEKLLQLLRELREAEIKNIILVDDGSGMDYRDIFVQAEEEHNCIVLRHGVNLGKGRALKTAFNYCLDKFPDEEGCVTADSDGQHSPECILTCASQLQLHSDALILGCRSFDEEHVPARSEFGNKCTRIVMKYLVGISVSDTQTGLRGIPMHFMRILLRVKGERFEFETNMLMETDTQKIPIIEVPIQTIYIEENKTSHFHPIRDSIQIYMIFGRFLFSSLSSSIVDLILFSMFCYLLKGQDTGIFSYITMATVMARILSALYNYSINYRVVFQSRKSVSQTIWKYALLAIVQMSCSALLVNLLYPFFGGFEVFVKIPVDVILFFLSFLIQREIVYK